MALLGNTLRSTYVGWGGPEQNAVGPFTASENGSATEIHVVLNLTANESVALGILADNNGEPGAALDSVEVYHNNSPSGTIECIATGRSVNLVAGSKYWVAWSSPYANWWSDPGNAGGVGKYKVRTYDGTIVTLSGYSTFSTKLNGWLVYTPTGGGTAVLPRMIGVPFTPGHDLLRRD